MKEQRFEKVVEWENDLGTPYFIFMAILIYTIFLPIAIPFLIYKDIKRVWNKRKVYWRKIK